MNQIMNDLFKSVIINLSDNKTTITKKNNFVSEFLFNFFTVYIVGVFIDLF